MDTTNRPYQYERYTGTDYENFDLNNTWVPLDTVLWKRPKIITLENLAGHLSIKINSSLNVYAVDCNGQGEDPTLPPDTYKVNTNAHIAIDDNYLYVWVPKNGRWKRVILNEW